MTSSRLTLLSLLLWFAFPWLPSSQAPQDEFSCLGCNGTGELELPCDLCEGDGKGPCQECKRSSGLIDPRVLAIYRRVDPDTAKKLDEQAAKLEKLQESMKGLMGAAAPNAQPEPGTLNCPARCRNGVSFLNRGHRCLPCKGRGTFRCTHCKGKGETKCAACAGKRKLPRACPECRGSGKGRNPLLRKAAEMPSCPWCSGEDLIECLSCDDDGGRERGCVRCSRTGKIQCRTCVGTGKKPCNKCSATGDLSSYFAQKDSNRCDQCKRKGVIPCDACSKGKLECPTCKGKKRGRLGCLECYGTKHDPCSGCFGSSGLAWVTTGDRLLAAERPADAVAHYDEAILREKLRHQAELDKLVDSPEQRKKTKKRLESELKALSKKAARARKQIK